MISSSSPRGCFSSWDGPAMKNGRLNPAWIVLLAGVSAAVHIGKLPPALPVLQRDLGITLVQSGFLLSLVQLATVLLGIVAGLAADGIGLKRCMLMGLWLLGAAGLAGGWAEDAGTLLALRAVEGVGFLLTTVPAPSLVRRIVVPGQLTRMMGFWGRSCLSAPRWRSCWGRWSWGIPVGLVGGGSRQASLR